MSACGIGWADVFSAHPIEAMSHAVENDSTGTGKLLFKLTRDSEGIFCHTQNIANDKVLFTLSFAALDLRRPKAAYFLGKSMRIRRRL